jgi:NDP-sugar pyrophosphorylase family protein
MTEDGAFSIISTYLRLAAEGQDVLGFRADEYYWLDLGRPQNVARAEEDLASGILSN